MAFLATLQWDVRTTGNDANGGAFDPTAGVPGTDYSLQDSPQVTYTDLVIDGTTNTKCTSAGTPFTSAHVGNVINITSGTGFTVQRVQIISVTASTATCDKSLGTLSSTGGHGNLGGALVTLAAAAAVLAGFNTVHVKAGTYTLTAAVAVPGTTQFWRGYGSTHSDGGTKPLITTATNSTQLFTAGLLAFLYLENLSLSNTAGTRGDAIRASSNYPTIYLTGCLLDGFDKAVNGDNGSSTGVAAGVFLVGTEIKNSATAAIASFQFLVSIHASYLHDNTKDALHLLTANQSFSITDSVFANNGRYVVLADGAATDGHISNSVFYQNGLTFTGHPFDALHGGGAILANIANSIFYGGATAYTSSASLLGRANAVDAQALLSTSYRSSGDQVLTADPFTSAATGDFSLNATAGGGPVCKAAGFPGAAPFGTSTALDIGAVQATGGGGGGGSVAANPLGGFVA